MSFYDLHSTTAFAICKDYFSLCYSIITDYFVLILNLLLHLPLSPLSPLPLSQNKNEKKTGSYICHADIPLPIFFVFILQP
jgi:hypothetical protein